MSQQLCDGRLEFRGFVNGAAIITRHKEVPCDGRCTNAAGPSCDCSCKGENHGSQRLITVERQVGSMPARISGARDAEQRAAVPREYRDLRDRVEAQCKTARGRTDPRTLILHQALYKAARLRRHTTRMDKSRQSRGA